VGGGYGSAHAAAHHRGHAAASGTPLFRLSQRIFSADGTKSIRFGGHEMRSIGTTKAHFHYEKWLFDPTSNTVYVENILQRLK